MLLSFLFVGLERPIEPLFVPLGLCGIAARSRLEVLPLCYGIAWRHKVQLASKSASSILFFNPIAQWCFVTCGRCCVIVIPKRVITAKTEIKSKVVGKSSCGHVRPAPDFSLQRIAFAVLTSPGSRFMIFVTLLIRTNLRTRSWFV